MALYITGEDSIDGFVNGDPFALLVAMVLDQQVPLEKAFAGPRDLRERLGGRLDPERVAALAPSTLTEKFVERPALHRFPAAMAERVQQLARIIMDEYGGEATKIWGSAKSGTELLDRVRRLPGFGERKAQIFVALLAKQFGVKPRGWQGAAGEFGEKGSHCSVADIDSPEALLAVRAYKQALKATAHPKAGKASRSKGTNARA